MKNLFSLPRAGWPKLLLFSCGLLAGARAQAQTAPAWQTAVAAAGDVLVQAVATDAFGNVYLTGGFSGGTATFGSTTLTSANAQEVFVAKWSSASSSFVWALQGSGSAATGQNSALALAVSGTSVYIAGSFSGATIAFGNTSALTNAQAGTSDIFVAKLTDAGTSASFSWTKQAGGTGNDYANALTIVGSGVYLGGSNGAAAGFNTNTLANAGGFIARFTDSGALPFPFNYVVPAGDAVNGLTATGASIFATGTFRSTAATFVDGTHTLTSAGGEDAFVLKVSNANLAYSWVQQAGGAGDDYARAIVPVPDGSGVYLAGSFRSSTIGFGSSTLTNPGTAGLFVAKLLDGGTTSSFGWALQNGGSNSTTYTSAYGLSATGTTVVVAGTFGGTASFGSTTLTSAGQADVLLAKLTDSGSSAAFTWAQQAGGSGSDYAYGVARISNQFYVAGQVAAPATFGGLSIGIGSGVRPGYLAGLTDNAPLLTLVAPTSAPLGSTVSLYGSGLAGATAVTFAGTSNNVVTSGFTVNAAGTQISGVVVPAGAQTGTLNVTTPLGTSNSLISFVVAPTNPAPAWQAVATPSAPTGTSNIQYTATDANGNILVAGVFTGTFSLGTTTLTSVGGSDIFVAKWSPASGRYLWAQRAGGPGADYVYGLAVNGANVYAVGFFDGATTSFGNTTLTNTASGSLDGFVTKITDAGSTASFTWAQLVGGIYDEYVETLAVSGNNVYIAGDFTSPALTLGSGGLSTNASSADGFVAKLLDAGPSVSLGWALGSGNSGGNGEAPDFYGLAVRGNTVYAAGAFYGTLNFGATQVASGNSNDVVVARISDAGSTASFTGAASAGGPGTEFVLGFVANGSNLYVSGFTSSATSTWGNTTLTSAGGSDGFVAKLTDTGSALSFGWAQLLGGPGSDRVYHLAANGNNVYAAGYFGGTASFGSTTLTSANSSTDGFVAKLADAGTSGSIAWVQQSGGIGGDTNYGVALSGTTVYVGGYVTPAAAFGNLAITSPLSTSVATLATLTDPTILATATPAAALVGSVALYPNPAHGTTTVRLAAGAEKQPLSLLDALGREVRRYPAPAAAATEATLDLAGVPAGLYVLRGSGSSGQKLQVQ